MSHDLFDALGCQFRRRGAWPKGQDRRLFIAVTAEKEALIDRLKQADMSVH